MPGGPLHAQDSSTISYPEGEKRSVATFTAEDPELAGDITWSLTGEDAGDFEIGESSGVLTFAEVPDYEAAADNTMSNVYAVTVVATDADGMATEEMVTVTVTNKDEDGTVTLSAVAPYPGVELTATHADPDGQITSVEWQWSKSRSKTSSNYADIEDAEAAIYSPTSGDQGFYLRATVTYNDGEGEGKSAMATSAHTVQAPNVPNLLPEFTDDDAEVNGNQTTRMVEENTAAGEDVGLPVEASDGDSDILTYTIDDTAATTFDIEAASGQIKTKGDLDTETTPTYTVTVTATDPAGDTDEITVTITVTGVNETPDITAEDVEYAETTADAPNTADVATFTAEDPENAGTVTLDLSGADASLFALSAGGVLTFNDPPNFEAPGDADKDNTYELTVGARDFDGNRGTEDIEVKVTNEDEDGTVTLSAVQPRVGVAVTASLTDIDGPVSGVTWQWSSNNTDIEDATSDTYTPVADDDGNRLTATATYTDPQGAEKTADVESANVAADTRNKAPVFDDQDDEEDGTQNTEATRTIAENSPATTSLNGGAVTATDPNAGAPLNDTVSYSLGGDDASSFDIGLTTGQITVGTGTKLDYETKTTYMVTVIATDSYGESASIAVTITVTPVNEGPEITVTVGDVDEYEEGREDSVATFTAEDPENAGAVKWTLTGDDAEDFKIGESSGVLTFAEVPNYEAAADNTMNNVYAVTVVATDADGMATEELVTVTVTNKDEDGTVSLDKLAPYPGVDLTATHTDPDDQITSAEWQWSRSRSKTSSNYADIEDAEAAIYSPTSGDQGFYLRATVTYNDGEGEGKSAMATSAHTVQAPNVPNLLPEFTDDDAEVNGNQTTRMVEENTAAGEDVGLPVEASDGDSDILTYTIDDTAATTFDIEAASGQIKTKGDLDTETTPTYTVTVTATDPAGDTDEITVTITVTGVNETPDITAEDVEYAETTADAPNTADVATFTAEDPENAGTVTLDLSGADASLFALSAGGVLTFNDPPNFEAPGDADKDNTYELTVGARDFDGNRGTEDIEVKVTNEDEDGTVTLSAVQPRVGVAVTASLTDIDGPVSGVTWQWSSNNTDIEDATSDTYTPVADDDGNRLTATATYTDPQGAEKTADVESANVAADTRNKAPVFDDQDDEEDGTQNTEATRTIAENSPATTSLNGGAVTATDPNAGAPLNDTVSYSLGGDDASSFDIGLTTGQITVGTGTKLDYETKTTYMVTVIATDSYGESASIAVTITVTPVNEGPEITVTVGDVDENVAPEFADSEDGARSVAENTMAGEDIGAPVAASDADDAALTYTLSGTDAASFDIDQATGQLKTKADLDYETKASYAVTVTATDGDTASDSIDVTITVTDVDENLPPEFPSAATTTREVAENTMAGEDIGAPVAASDADDAALTYTLSGTDAASFDIDQATGQLKTKADLDYETKASYAVTVTATDGDTASDSIDVTITVTDVDEMVTGDDLVDRYDADDSGDIDKTEVLKAINDYLFGEGDEAISKPEVLRLINIYLFGG